MVEVAPIALAGNVLGEKVTAIPLPSAELLIVMVPVPPVTVTVTWTVLPRPEVTVAVLSDIDIGTLKFAVAVSGLVGITIAMFAVLQLGLQLGSEVQSKKAAPGAVAVGTRFTVVPEVNQQAFGVIAQLIPLAVIVPEKIGFWRMVR